MARQNALASVTAGGLLIAAFTLSAAVQIADTMVKTSLMTDITGNYSDIGGKVKGMLIRLVSANHQNKMDRLPRADVRLLFSTEDFWPVLLELT